MEEEYKVVRVKYDRNTNLSQERNVSIWIRELMKEISRLLDEQNHISALSGNVDGWRFNIKKLEDTSSEKNGGKKK